MQAVCACPCVCAACFKSSLWRLLVISEQLRICPADMFRALLEAGLGSKLRGARRQDAIKFMWCFACGQI